MADNIISTVVTTIRSQVSGITNKISSTANWSNIMSRARTKLSSFIRRIIDLLIKKPSSKQDYVKIGRNYFSKRALFYAVIFLGIGVYFTTNFAYPWADGRLWYATMTVNSEKYNSFSGKAKVYDNVHVLIYEGQMSEGVISGKGKQYDARGNLVYIGNFENNQYSGQGELYSNGIMIYSGTFAQNLYEGEGKQYDQKGNLIYSGSFLAGQRSGTGVEYDPDTQLKIYYGAFLNGAREGKGTAYAEDGSSILYEGDFLAGKYDGQGTLYDSGKLKYKGEFSNGLYEGAGVLYDIDTGKVLYDGEFKAGKYDGKGKLYDSKTGTLVYEGEFVGGAKEGEGASYDDLGALSFSGAFKDGNVDYINYIGKSDSDVTAEFGKESYRTERDGMLILTYLGQDISVIFEGDEKGVYACTKIVKGTKDSIFGLNANSSQEDIQSVLGSPYSSINYTFASYYSTVFENLSINLSVRNAAPSDKFVMENYFVRFYYNSDKTKVECVEISTI